MSADEIRRAIRRCGESPSPKRVLAELADGRSRFEARADWEAHLARTFTLRWEGSRQVVRELPA